MNTEVKKYLIAILILGIIGLVGIPFFGDNFPRFKELYVPIGFGLITLVSFWAIRRAK